MIINHNNNMKSLSEQYLESLTPKERQAYEIAKSYLGSLFTLEKTTGFVTWSAAMLKPAV